MGKKRYRQGDVSKDKTTALGIDALCALKTSSDTHYEAVHERYFSDDKLKCPACGSMKTRCSKVVRRSFKDILWGEETENEDGTTTRKFQVIDLTFHQRYWRCDGCNESVFPEPIDFGDKGCRYTNRLSDALADGTFRFSYKKVCDYFGVPASTASIGPIMRRRIQYRESQLLPISTPRHIGIIEVPFYRDNYVIVFAFLPESLNKDIYCMDILPDAFEGTVLEYLRTLDASQVEAVYIDPVDGIQSAASIAFPGTELIVTNECILRYAKSAMLKIIHEDGKRFPLKFKDNALTILNRHLQNEHDKNQITAGMASRPRLKKAYDKHQELMELMQGEWTYEALCEWVHNLPDDLPEFTDLIDVVDLFEQEIKRCKEREKLPDSYPTAVQAICEAFKGMPHCIFDVLRARCFLTINHDTIEVNGEKYRLGIHTSRLTQNMKQISDNIKEARDYGL